jgi:hypothetical protein
MLYHPNTGSQYSGAARLSLKLRVDTKAHQILFVQRPRTAKDTVEFLFSLQALAVGTTVPRSCSGWPPCSVAPAGLHAIANIAKSMPLTSFLEEFIQRTHA